MTNQSVVWRWVAGFSVMVVLVGCAEAERMSAGKYSVDRFGERSSIHAVVDQSVANVVTDTRINGQLASTDIRKLKGHLVGPVCMATGGPALTVGGTWRRSMPA